MVVVNMGAVRTLSGFEHDTADRTFPVLFGQKGLIFRRGNPVKILPASVPVCLFLFLGVVLGPFRGFCTPKIGSGVVCRLPFNGGAGPAPGPQTVRGVPVFREILRGLFGLAIDARFHATKLARTSC